MAAYRIDVLDPRVSTRRVWVLLERLPPHVRRPGEHWSTEAELLAQLVDEIANLTWVTLRAYGSKTSRPKPVKRPPERRRPAARDERSPWLDLARQLAGIPGVEVSVDQLHVRDAYRPGLRRHARDDRQDSARRDRSRRDCGQAGREVVGL